MAATGAGTRAAAAAAATPLIASLAGAGARAAAAPTATTPSFGLGCLGKPYRLELLGHHHLCVYAPDNLLRERQLPSVVSDADRARNVHIPMGMVGTVTLQTASGVGELQRTPTQRSRKLHGVPVRVPPRLPPLRLQGKLGPLVPAWRGTLTGGRSIGR